MRFRKHTLTVFLGVSMAAAGYAQGPTITSFNPALSAVGLPVYIAGTNFTGATSVTFDGKAAQFLVDSPELIVALVPLSARTGVVKVATPAGSASGGVYDIVSTYWDAVQNFSAANNPNGQWTYGTEPSPSGTFTADTLTTTLFTDCPYWYGSTSENYSSGVALNMSLYTHQYLTVIVPTDMLYMNSEANASVVRWTAPATGRYWIFGEFQGLDLDLANVTVTIYANGNTILFVNSLSFFGDYKAFILKAVPLNQGATVDFVVSSTSVDYDNVGLTATIDQIE